VFVWLIKMEDTDITIFRDGINRLNTYLKDNNNNESFYWVYRGDANTLWLIAKQISYHLKTIEGTNIFVEANKFGCAIDLAHYIMRGLHKNHQHHISTTANLNSSNVVISIGPTKSIYCSQETYMPKPPDVYTRNISGPPRL